jgi:dsDNA-specific endonuclease/ATPase MutS2
MDFWIGDKVRLKKSGRFGEVTATSKDGKIKVKCGDSVITTSPTNLEIIKEDEFTFPDWVFEESDKKDVKKVASKDTIDLHIEILEPSMATESAAVILQYQVKRCKAFFETNIQKSRSVVFIICGKGEGVLKAEIEHLAKHTFQARFIFERNNGGMLEIWL